MSQVSRNPGGFEMVLKGLNKAQTANVTVVIMIVSWVIMLVSEIPVPPEYSTLCIAGASWLWGSKNGSK